jgi:hypothetical protein
MAGCSENNNTPAPTTTAENEAVPQEAPTEVLELLEANTPSGLDLTPAEGPLVTTWPSYDEMDNYDVYAVTFIWGQFLGNHLGPVAEPTDWSGDITVNGVVEIHPRMTIDFEPDEDWLIEEEQPSYAAWVSQAAMDFDGISFLIFYDRDIVYIVAPWLTFDAGPALLRWDFAELAKLTAFYTFENGNALAVHSRKIWPDRCTGGFLEGDWIRDDNTGTSGRFEGLWLNYRGEPEGLMNGEFWTNNDGTREFSGWVSGYWTDHIIAEYKGHWRWDDPAMCMLCGQGHGWFRGRFVYADGSEKGGMLMGEFGHIGTPTTDAATLPFKGIWRDCCPWHAVNPGYEGGL